MAADDSGTLTHLLQAWSDGDASAQEELMERVYGYLRGMAANHLRLERRGHTLDTGALVHEAYFRLVHQEHVRWNDRRHFFAIAARMMRRVLTDHARRRGAVKRGAGIVHLTPEDLGMLAVERPADLVALDEALHALAETDTELRDIVELHYFGGLSKEEIAETVGLSGATVTRRLRLARAWLYRVLVECENPGDLGG